MSGKLAGLFFAISFTVLSSGACAMNSPRGEQPHCRVIGGEKLSGHTIGAADVCAAIKRAVATRGANVDYHVEVRVLSPSRLAATISLANGRKLPDLNLASMDRAFSKGSIDRFAQTIAVEIVKNVQ
jgi:hypothetical protein